MPDMAFGINQAIRRRRGQGPSSSAVCTDFPASIATLHHREGHGIAGFGDDRPYRLNPRVWRSAQNNTAAKTMKGIVMAVIALTMLMDISLLLGFETEYNAAIAGGCFDLDQTARAAPKSRIMLSTVEG